MRLFDTDRWQRLGRKIEQNTMMTDGSDNRAGRENLDCEKHGSQVMLEAPRLLFSETEQQQNHEHPEEATQGGLTQQHLTPNQPIINSLAKRKKSLERKIWKKAFFTEPERVPIWFVVSEHTDRVHLCVCVHDMRLLPNETRLNCSVKQVDVFVAWEKLTWFLEKYMRNHEGEDEFGDATSKTMSPALREKTKEVLRNFVLPDALIDDA